MYRKFERIIIREHPHTLYLESLTFVKFIQFDDPFENQISGSMTVTAPYFSVYLPVPRAFHLMVITHKHEC